jgi:hypothetical protein
VIPDDGPTYTNPLLDGQKPVEVGVKNLTEYAGKIFDIYTNSLGPSAKAFAHIPTLLSKGLTMPNDGVEPLAEGNMAMQMMKQRIADFQAFLGDMNNGIMALAYASQVVAYCYDDADGENSARIGDIAFAFADNGAQKPDGFDNRLLVDGGKTMEQQQEEAAAKAGGNLGANEGLYGSTAGAEQTYSTPYGSSWTWPDGSRMTSATSVQTERGSDGNRVTVYVTTYTIYDKDGNAKGTRVVRTSTDSSTGSTTESTKISSGGNSQEDSVTTYSDGHIATTSTQTTTDQNGQQQTTSTTQVTTPEDHGGDSTDQDGPVETAENTYDTHGSQRGQQQYGY